MQRIGSETKQTGLRAGSLGWLASLMTNRKGVTAMEYAVFTAAIVVAIATVVGSLGTTLSKTFANISKAL
jgi:Flp pilus assembly pilin Flp